MPTTAPRIFNFRDVLNEIGVPLTNETNWAAGNMLRKLAADYGIEPMRILADKTDPNPTVAAQHCIAHYPMSFYPVAVEHLRDYFEGEKRQGKLF